MTATRLQMRVVQFLTLGIVLSLLTTVAGVNLFVLLLLPFGFWAWRRFQIAGSEKRDVFILFGLIIALCAVDVFSNLNAGHDIGPTFKKSLSDLRVFGFIIILWPLFSSGELSKRVFWGLVFVVIVLSGADLISVALGGYQYVLPGSGADMNGQILVGLFFVLAQLLLVYPKSSWKIAPIMSIMLAGLFLASVRRTGWILLLAGAVVWLYLNRNRLIHLNYRKWFVATGVAVVLLMAASPQVSERIEKIGEEANLFLQQTTEDRVSKPTSVGLRMQYVLSSIELIKQSGWAGVGSLSFNKAFWQVNGSVDGLQSLYANPHNEYLYMWATKGVAGLILYLAIFGQASRMAMKKVNEVQSKGMIMMIFLFMLSITANSMMIDMAEGHFAMLMMLVFLAPKNLNLLTVENK